MKKKKDKKSKNKKIILLKDLAPVMDVNGGSGKVLFGERIDFSEEHKLSGKQIKIKKVKKAPNKI